MNYALFGEKGFLGNALKPHCLGLANFSSEVWINARARVMGIGGNQKFPADLLTRNLKSAIEVFEQAVAYDRKRVVNFGSTCAYSIDAPVPFQPKDYLVGEPEPTNSGYAIAKRTIYSMSRAYNQQYGMDNLYLVMPNLYGPGCHFGPYNHVIPDMIEKVQAALACYATEIVFRGTGSPEREFLYITDAVQLILRAIRECHSPEPVHLTSGQVVTIKQLAEKICWKMGFKGHIRWDASFPDGQLKRTLATGLEWVRPMSLDDGLDSTIAYYYSQLIPQEENV